ncbi:hypothetical protein [Sagittula sp. SSi028]|uniref:hypothetical protein n=1 Tax=Sagittula sp. SSi028 TaxID=3400636 RepID=UPI003AF92017
MGQTDIRRLLIVGASCRRHAFGVTSVIRWVVRKGGSANRWLAALVARKPRMVAASTVGLEPMAPSPVDRWRTTLSGHAFGMPCRAVNGSHDLGPDNEERGLSNGVI